MQKQFYIFFILFSMAYSFVVNDEVSSNDLTSDPAIPISEVALLEEDKYFSEMEKRVLENSKNKNAKVDNRTFPDTRKSANSLKERCRRKVDLEEKVSKVSEKKRDKGFEGLYIGLSGAMVHRYLDMENYSKKYSAPAGTLLEKNTLGFGSYATDDSKFQMSSAIFLGYNFPLVKCFFLGFEIDGACGWREHEVGANGVFAENKEDLTKSFTFLGKNVTEVDFAYVKQVMRSPYHVSVLPRISFMLSSGTTIFTTMGMRYCSWEIDDCTETRNVVTKNSQTKNFNDTIYSSKIASMVYGIGMEALISKNAFLRFECQYHKGPELEMDKGEDIKNAPAESEENKRQLQYFKIKSTRNFSFGIGGGLKF